jgi:hypothetical protein
MGIKSQGKADDNDIFTTWLFIPMLWICRCRLLYLDFLFPCCGYVVVVCFTLTFYSYVVDMSLSSALPWLFIPMLWICRCHLLYFDFLFLCCEYVVVVCFTLTFYSHVVDMSLSSALLWLFIPMLWICRCRLLYLDFLFPLYIYPQHRNKKSR